MKTFKKRLVLVVVLMLGTLANYANDKEVNNNLNAKKTKVVFKGAKKGEQLTIKDHKGVILHLENINKAGNLIKFFDFSKLDDGMYTLELEKDFQIVIKTIHIKGDKVIFDEEAKKVIFKPVVRNEENRLMISKIAFDALPLKVLLYYNDEIIYSEVLQSDTIINRVYKLDENVKGEYTVVIKNNGRNYINEFKI
ncbi:hypothetical protein [Polaribacter sp. R77954]|uniref:hypothetical protein n=1 Tax=Polaribacter sp. R77954 TaxID=3093870 RepID=UPI0037C946A5